MFKFVLYMQSLPRISANINTSHWFGMTDYSQLNMIKDLVKHIPENTRTTVKIMYNGRAMTEKCRISKDGSLRCVNPSLKPTRSISTYTKQNFKSSTYSVREHSMKYLYLIWLISDFLLEIDSTHKPVDTNTIIQNIGNELSRISYIDSFSIESFDEFIKIKLAGFLISIKVINYKYQVTIVSQYFDYLKCYETDSLDNCVQEICV